MFKPNFFGLTEGPGAGKTSDLYGYAKEVYVHLDSINAQVL